MKRIIVLFLGLMMCSSALAENTEPLQFITFGDHPPYHNELQSEGLEGFDIDLVREISNILDREIIVRKVPKDEVIDIMLDGKADAVLGITESQEGLKIFDYSTPYLIHKTRIFMNQQAGLIRTLTDLKNVRVLVRQGADVKEYLKIVPGIQLFEEQNANVALEKVLSQKNTVYMGDEHEAQYFIRKNNLQGIATLGGAFLLRRRTIAVIKGNTELLDPINAALDELHRDLKLEALSQDWFVKRFEWSGSDRSSLMMLLAVLAVVAAILLVTVIWNQILSAAVKDKTREMQSEHEHYESIFDHASDGIVILDPKDATVIDTNLAFENILGYTGEELKGLALKEIDATQEQSFATHIQRSKESGDNVLFETRLLHKSRQPVDLFVHASIFPSRGKTYVQAIARDITQQKKIDDMKDTILQDVAHELKTPMAKLSMSLDLLEKSLNPEERSKYEKYFGICQKSVLRLQSTIEGILNLSRLESHSQTGDVDIFIIQEIIQNVLTELEMFADRKKVKLVNVMLDEPILIKGDMEMIRRLYVNLIHNAIKFTEAGGSVTVSLEKDDQFVKVSVQDEGIGLEKDDLSRIFARFFQKSASYEGSGVGLTICEKIVSFHNGVIWAESEGLGHGATMNTLFPYYQSENDKK